VILTVDENGNLFGSPVEVYNRAIIGPGRRIIVKPKVRPDITQLVR